ncbi:FAD:protein FMN transferase [Furfurilactobacillus entadae]|uniref:FAD:protein FMN transferase n=1 Tax=Furfurilactobacillus entadae TaxID=2922307 RepID=UPI0035E8C658
MNEMQAGWAGSVSSEGLRHQESQGFHALGTKIQLTTFGIPVPGLLAQSKQLVNRFEDELTVNRPASEVMAINHAAGDHPVQVSGSTYTLVKMAVAASLENSGFNATIGPLVKAWHIGFADAHKPAEETLARVQRLIDPQQVVLDDALQSVFLKSAGMELDLGAIAKGYIADRIHDLWQSAGISAGMINLGGNLLFVGSAPTHADQRWRIGIQDPWSARGATLGRVILPACSAVTSGVYERHLTVDGHDYHHILDGRTGYPFETTLASVTVFSRQSVIGEIESTRLFFAGGADETWLAAHPDCYGAVFIDKDHQLSTVGLTQQDETTFGLA